MRINIKNVYEEEGEEEEEEEVRRRKKRGAPWASRALFFCEL